MYFFFVNWKYQHLESENSEHILQIIPNSKDKHYDIFFFDKIFKDKQEGHQEMFILKNSVSFVLSQDWF